MMESIATGFWEGIKEYYELNPELVLALVAAIGIQNYATAMAGPQAAAVALMLEAAEFSGTSMGQSTG